jgi:hypothetical protein
LRIDRFYEVPRRCWFAGLVDVGGRFIAAKSHEKRVCCASGYESPSPRQFVATDPWQADAENGYSFDKVSRNVERFCSTEPTSHVMFVQQSRE